MRCPLCAKPVRDTWAALRAHYAEKHPKYLKLLPPAPRLPIALRRTVKAR